MLKYELSPLHLTILEIIKGEAIYGTTMLQKLSFLLLKKYPLLFDQADFIPHKYGGLSLSITEITSELLQIGALNDKKDVYQLSNSGEQLCNELEEFHLENAQKKVKFLSSVRKIKEKFNKFTRNQILAYVYKSDPKYTIYSLIEPTIDYEKEFLECYFEDKLDINEIAELLNMSLDYVQNIIDYFESNSEYILELTKSGSKKFIEMISKPNKIAKETIHSAKDLYSDSELDKIGKVDVKVKLPFNL